MILLRGAAAVTAACLIASGGGLTAASDRFDGAIATGRAVLQRMVEAGEAPGVAIGVAVAGAVVWKEGFGHSNIDGRIPATGDTRFGLGSISKTLTMAAVMRMVDEGRIDLDAPVERYLPDFPHAGAGVTIRRLAAHQSGISDAFSSEHYRSTRHFATMDEAYQAIKTGRLEFAPGSKTQYATGLYTIIARAMEEAAGAPYLEVMDKLLFSPARLPGIGPNDPRRADPSRTRFYMRRPDGSLELGPPFDPSHKLAGAGFLATAADIARFGAALIGASLLSDHGKSEMFRPVPLAGGTPTEFALGLRHSVQSGRVVLHQPGGGIGISSWLYLYPREQLAIGLLSNLTGAPVGGATHRQVADPFLKALETESTPRPSAPSKRAW